MTVRICWTLAAVGVVSLVLWRGGCSAGGHSPVAGPPASAPVSATLPAGSQPAGGLTETFCRDALAWIDQALSDGVIEKMVPAAEKAADRFIAGGDLLVTGNEGFCDEMYYRAGGFPFTAIWQAQTPGDKDVVLVGLYRPDGDDFQWGLDDPEGRKKTFGGALIVHIAGHRWPMVRAMVQRVAKGPPDERLVLLDTGVPAGQSLREISLGQFATTALAWAFHGEVLAAATRKGKTLATYASDWEPDGQEWDDSVRGHHLHPTYKVPPIPAGEIGARYLKICRKQIAEFARTQPGQVRLGAERLARAIKGGGRGWIVTNAHIHPRGSVLPSTVPRLTNCGREGRWHWVAGDIAKGDMLVWFGYLRYPREQVEEAVRLGAQVVSFSVDAGVSDDRRVHVLSCWADWDTVIDLPKYPIRVLPSSGVVQTPQWYALMAETQAAYQRLRLGGPP